MSTIANTPPGAGFNRTMPPSTVIPQLVYEDVAEAIAWLCEKFGFQVRWQAGDHRAQLWLNGGTVVVTEPRTSKALPGPQPLLVRVPDVRAHYERARERGAKILEDPREFHMESASTLLRISAAITGASRSRSPMSRPSTGAVHPVPRCTRRTGLRMRMSRSC